MSQPVRTAHLTGREAAATFAFAADYLPQLTDTVQLPCTRLLTRAGHIVFTLAGGRPQQTIDIRQKAMLPDRKQVNLIYDFQTPGADANTAAFAAAVRPEVLTDAAGFLLTDAMADFKVHSAGMNGAGNRVVVIGSPANFMGLEPHHAAFVEKLKAEETTRTQLTTGTIGMTLVRQTVDQQSYPLFFDPYASNIPAKAIIEQLPVAER
jgi:hypothetical protein